jgi:hypothetical protein
MKNKMPKMDMGGLYMGASKSEDVANQPISGYGTSDADKCPPNCGPRSKPAKKIGPGSGAKHAKQVRQTQQKRTQTARKNIGKCGRK